MAKRIEELDKNFKDWESTAGGGLVWHAARQPPFAVYGLPWFEENGGEFIRLPKRAKGVVRDAVWELSTMPTNGRVRFKTDSGALSLRLQHSRPAPAGPHASMVSVSGVDLYEGSPDSMVYWVSSKFIQPLKPYVCNCFEGLPRKMREFTLYLPTYNDLVLLEIGLDQGAKVIAPSCFKNPKPVVFYGTSITQGGCSTRGATGYVPVVGRALGIDVVNLGFSGNGHSDPEVADLINEIEMACFVNDCVGNMSLEQMKTRYAAFNEKIRACRPSLPIVLMTFLRQANETFLPAKAKFTDERNAVVFQTYRKFRKRGDKNIHLLDCSKVIGLEADHPSVDGAHLSDIGFKRMADAITPMLRKVLQVGAARR